MPDDKPRVFVCMPSNGTCHVQAAATHYALATRGKTEIIPGLSLSSLLTQAFNFQWAMALNWHKAGIIDYWCLHHADVEIRTHGWLDVMIEEMRRVGAAVLSAVIPLKNESGETSTALETDNKWNPSKLTMSRCWQLPKTFSAADVPNYKGLLLVNTGLMLVDLSRPEFSTIDQNGDANFYFTINDRIATKPDGEFYACVEPEDWNFSRTCYQYGLPVFATWAVDVVHHGNHGFSNQPPEGAT